MTVKIPFVALTQMVELAHINEPLISSTQIIINEDEHRYTLSTQLPGQEPKLRSWKTKAVAPVLKKAVATG